MRAEGTQYPSRVSQAFLDIVSDNSLEQMVDFPTRKDKTLDLLFTSHPSHVEKCKPLPSIGNSDHDIVLLDTSFVFRPQASQTNDIPMEERRYPRYPGRSR